MHMVTIVMLAWDKVTNNKCTQVSTTLCIDWLPELGPDPSLNPTIWFPMPSQPDRPMS